MRMRNCPRPFGAAATGTSYGRDSDQLISDQQGHGPRLSAAGTGRRWWRSPSASYSDCERNRCHDNAIHRRAKPSVASTYDGGVNVTRELLCGSARRLTTAGLAQHVSRAGSATPAQGHGSTPPRTPALILRSRSTREDLVRWTPRRALRNLVSPRRVRASLPCGPSPRVLQWPACRTGTRSAKQG